MWHIWHVHICTWVLMSVLRLKTRYYETDVTLTDDDTNSTVTDDANPNCNQRKRHPHVVKFVTCGKLCVNLLRRNNRMDWLLTPPLANMENRKPEPGWQGRGRGCWRWDWYNPGDDKYCEVRGIRDMMRMMRMMVAIRLIYSWRGIVETHAGGNLTE